jgi:hypothetical protein
METTHSPLNRAYFDHPLWPKWQQASPALRAAFNDDFMQFAFYNEKGYDLASVERRVAKEASKRIHEEMRAQEKRDLEQSLKAARSSEEFRSIMAAPGFNARNYPGLKDEAAKAHEKYLTSRMRMR